MDIAGELIGGLFTTPVIICLSILGVLGVIALIVLIIRSTGFGSEQLTDHLDDEIVPNGYFENELEKCSIELAHKMMKYQHGSDFEPYRRRMLKKLKPLFLQQTTKVGRSFVVVTFSPVFVDYVYEYYDSALVRDFSEVAWEFIKYMHSDIPIVVHKESSFEKYLTDSLVNEMRQAEDIYNAEVELAKETKRLAEDENSPANVKKRIVSAYNATIQEIKSHNNRGLNPSNIEALNDRFLVKILSFKVFTQQKLFDMTSEQAMEFNGQGCYVIYNTYTRKYFVGQSDTMFTRVYTLLTSPAVKACAALKKDIDEGHMVLVKFISFEDSGYGNINRLHRDLIMAYDCRQEKGYNK